MSQRSRQLSNSFFSVVIATKNSESYLRTCLDSLREQTFKNFEVLILDALSIDKTAQIAKKNSDLVKHFSSERDEGIYDAWNRGLRYSSGDWIIFLGSDDVMLPNTLSSYYDTLSKNPGIKFLSSKVEIKKDGCRYKRIFGEKFEWSIMRKYMCVAHVGAAHHRSLFSQFGNFDINFKICGDYEFLLRLGENISMDFLDDITCEMLGGGASEKFPEALFEAYKAKLKWETRSQIAAFYDLSIAILKYAWRQTR